MALVAPLLIALMFGAMELGYYFYSEHIVIKAVRDGARFASRRSFSNYTCPGGGVDAAVVSDTQRVTRTNQVATGGSARLPLWTDNASVAVALRCVPLGTYGALYAGMTDVPVIVVTATVPYSSLFGTIGFNALSLTMNASSEVPVMGA